MWSVLSNPQYLVPALCLAESMVQAMSLTDQKSIIQDEQDDVDERNSPSGASVNKMDSAVKIFKELAEYAVALYVAGGGTPSPGAAAIGVIVPRLARRFTSAFVALCGTSTSKPTPYGELGRVAGICSLIISAKSAGQLYACSNNLGEQAGRVTHYALLVALNENLFLSYEGFNEQRRRSTQDGIWVLSILTQVGLTLAGANLIVGMGLSTATSLIVHGLAKRYWAAPQKAPKIKQEALKIKSE